MIFYYMIVVKILYINSKEIKVSKGNTENSDKALLAAYNTIQHSQITISMAAKAIATCSAYANIDCEELKSSNKTTNIYLDIASKSYAEAKAHARMCHEYMSKTLSIREKSISEMANQMAYSAVHQAHLAADVTAKASAQCSVIIKIKCNECVK